MVRISYETQAILQIVPETKYYFPDADVVDRLLVLTIRNFQDLPLFAIKSFNMGKGYIFC